MHTNKWRMYFDVPACAALFLHITPEWNSMSFSAYTRNEKMYLHVLYELVLCCYLMPVWCTMVCILAKKVISGHMPYADLRRFMLKIYLSFMFSLKVEKDSYTTGKMMYLYVCGVTVFGTRKWSQPHRFSWHSTWFFGNLQFVSVKIIGHSYFLRFRGTRVE